MIPSKPIKKFHSTITELYAICRTCWNSCMANIALFTAFKTFYDAAYVTTALDEITAAEAMPSEGVRNTEHELQRIALEQKAEDCLTQWRKLRAYIKSSYPVELVEALIDGAGGTWYDSAANQNWEDLQQMMVEGKEFITENEVALTAGGMPTTFPDDYDGAFSVFQPKYDSFKDAQQEAEEETVNRMNANNALYDRVQAMNADGQIIFENDPAKYDRFVFARVKELVTPPSGSETILQTEEGTVDGGLTKNIANLPAECTKVRMFVPGLGPLQYSFSVDGATPNGNTVTLGDDGQTTATVAEFASAGTIFIVKNLNGGTVGYKVEFIK